MTDSDEAWINLKKLIMMCPDPEGWDLRGKLIDAARTYGEASHDDGREAGFVTGVHVGQESRDC